MGSAQLITDNEGKEYERIEYTPYGEYWIEKIYSGSTLLSLFSTTFAAQNSVSNRKVATFMGKERDEARTIALLLQNGGGKEYMTRDQVRVDILNVKEY